MEAIKFVDLQTQYLRIKSEVDGAIQEVLNSTAFIQGPQVEQFADALSQQVKCPYVITCANGTDALQISMMALDFKPGDEIILPVHTYAATAEVIALLKLQPVFADVHPGTFNIDVTQLDQKVTDKTVAIVPVHLYGQCADMEDLMAFAEKHHLAVIEDTAQALGSVYEFSNGTRKHAGTIGTVGTTSFFPSKNLGGYGDGGAIFTADPVLAEKMRMIANHGQKKKYYHDIIGINSRLDTLQAAILKVKLRYLDEYSARRNEVATFYDRALADLPGLRIPMRSERSTHVFHQYTVTITDGSRDRLKEYLAKEGVPTMVYYPIPLHYQKAYQVYGAGQGSFPVAEELSQTVLSLPIHTEMTTEQKEFIVDKIIRFYN